MPRNMSRDKKAAIADEIFKCILVNENVWISLKSMRLSASVS